MAVLGDAPLAEHAARVVGQHVDRRVALQQLLGQGADIGQPRVVDGQRFGPDVRGDGGCGRR
jgi:hypothetical protein